MKLQIEVFETPDAQLGKMTKKTYQNIPKYKRPVLSKESAFFLGDLIGPSITINVLEDDTLKDDTMYVSKEAKAYYYRDKDYIKLA